MNHNDYAKKIISELEGKYNKEFEIESLALEFSGENGRYYRAECKEKGSDFSFVACYYYDDEELFDEYCSALLNESLADYLVSSCSGVFHAVVAADTEKYVLTMGDVEKGVEYCMSKKDFDIVTSAYLFVGCEGAPDLQAEKKITEKILELTPTRCFVEVIYVDASLVSTMKEEFNVDFYDVDDKLENDSRILRHVIYSVSGELGANQTEVVKGE